jgi:hypothetical protein
MNYYAARELKTKDGKPSGLWHFTKMRDGQIWAVGYCADACPGHKTKEEAYAHYKKYLLERQTTFNLVLHNWTSCVACDRPTRYAAQVGAIEVYPLCEKCMNLSTLETLVEVGEEVSSY